MAELVREDQPHLARVAVLDERVEEDDASSATEPGHVGILLPRPPTRVRDENMLDGHARAHGELAQRARELFVLERRETVEDGLEHDRRDEREQDDEHRADDGRREWPPRGEPACEADDADHRRAGEDQAHAEPFDPVGRPTAGRLRRESPDVLAPVARPERDRGQEQHRERRLRSPCRRPSAPTTAGRRTGRRRARRPR